MRSLRETYWHLIEKFVDHPSGDYEFFIYPEGEEAVYVSLSHAACLRYIIWLCDKSKDNMQMFTEVALKWRKTRASVLGPRPYIMRAAALLKKRLVALRVREKQAMGGYYGTKTQLENKIGVHSENYPMEKHIANGKKGQAKQMEEGKPPHTKHWFVIDPYGRKLNIYNLREFCRKHNLCVNHMYGVASGKRKHHKGYWCARRNPDEHVENPHKR